MVSDKGVQMVNKLTDLINKTSSTMATISQKLGICPSARVRHEGKVNKPDQPSEMDGMLD